MKEVKFLFVEKEVCREKLGQLSLRKIKPIKGTMDLHDIAYDNSMSALRT